jgi:hypothetical protein
LKRLARVCGRLLAVPIALLCGGGLLAGCGNTIQSQELSASTLEPLVEAEHYPVFWLGTSFHRLPLTLVETDPSGAYSLQYGTCTTGGPETCISPLQLITNPDNSFLPGATTASAVTSLRGVRATLLQGGKVIEIPTGPAIVDIRAASSTLALAAARQMVPINELGRPYATLAKALPNTGFAAHPMEGQRPSTVLGAPSAR